jgi:hypothetical protein
LVDRALKNAKAAYHGVAIGSYDASDNIRNTLWLDRENRMGASIGTPWFPQWSGVGKDGGVPFVSTLNNERAAILPWHSWAVKRWKRINGVP